MNTKILNILCEGLTEEKFAKEVLAPYFKDKNIVVKYRQLLTNSKKSARGGMISYNQAKGDLSRWMKEVAGHNSETHYFTTMFDLYALPTDFPGYSQSQSITDAYTKVEQVEEHFKNDINTQNFIPYIQLHEFEALLFCDIEKLTADYPKCKKEIEKLGTVLEQYHGNPELIDNSPQTAPSKRIKNAIEGKKQYKYNKPKSGTKVAATIGMDKLKGMCKHFRDWIEQIEKATGIIQQ